jgi:uroporphyrinogen decarboxylase
MGHKAPDLISTGAKIISLDWTINLRRMRQSIGQGAAFQGNLDPVTLTTTPEITRREAQRVLDEAGEQPGFIFNLGHGMIPSAKMLINSRAPPVKRFTRPRTPPPSPPTI